MAGGVCGCWSMGVWWGMNGWSGMLSGGGEDQCWGVVGHDWVMRYAWCRGMGGW